MKKCTKCKVSRLQSEFYSHPKTRDGLLLECKQCCKEAAKARRKTNPEIRLRDLERSKTPKRKKKASEYLKKWRSKNPIAYAAHTKVGNAVRDGKLAKLPCQICGDLKVHAHHKDYTQPLDVIWLCPRCHHSIHAIFPELEGLNKHRSAQ